MKYRKNKKNLKNTYDPKQSQMFAFLSMWLSFGRLMTLFAVRSFKYLNIWLSLQTYDFIDRNIRTVMYFRAISGENHISDSQLKTVFDSQIQSLNDRRLIFWILGINIPISHCVKNNWCQSTPSLKTKGGPWGPPPVICRNFLPRIW